MAKMLSVTITEEQGEFIKEHDISPSYILQGAIENIRETSKISEKFVQELQRKISFLQGTIDKQRNFIEAKGLIDEFIGL